MKIALLSRFERVGNYYEATKSLVHKSNRRGTGLIKSTTFNIAGDTGESRLASSLPEAVEKAERS